MLNADIRKSFLHCFVRAGNRVPAPKHPKPTNQSLLCCANDWQLLVDYEHKKVVFPPIICSTNLRPDVMIWSPMARRDVLHELTCPAEEGIQAAQIRKDARYRELLESIKLAGWLPDLFTIEVGARGLVGGSTFRVLMKLGLPSAEANALCKTLSAVVARCSYAVYLAHNSLVWSHNTDLVIGTPSSPYQASASSPASSSAPTCASSSSAAAPSFVSSLVSVNPPRQSVRSGPGSTEPSIQPPQAEQQFSQNASSPLLQSLYPSNEFGSPRRSPPSHSVPLLINQSTTQSPAAGDTDIDHASVAPAFVARRPSSKASPKTSNTSSLQTSIPNIRILRFHNILHLFHFTDSANLNSIRRSGLMSASNLQQFSIPSRMNSDELSRKLDSRAQLQNYVRLSFCSNNPMMHVAKKEGRISDPVLLQIKLEVVSRPGVLFSDCNAVRRGAIISQRLDHIHFDIVKAGSAFAIPPALRHFYQAEVLIPSPLPPHLIIFPDCAKMNPRSSPSSVPLPYPPTSIPCLAPGPSSEIHLNQPTLAIPPIQTQHKTFSISSVARSPPLKLIPIPDSTVLPSSPPPTARPSSNLDSRPMQGHPPVISNQTSTAAGFAPSTTLCVNHGVFGPSCDPQPHQSTDEILAIWDLLNSAYVKALHANDFQEMSEILDYYPPLPCRPPLCPHPPLDTEPVPPPTFCEYQVGALDPSCRECIPGLYVCPKHESLCGDAPWIQCASCNRCVCWIHLDCFCTNSQ